jgi:D-3-phosphoglycerate dehydrogenase
MLQILNAEPDGYSDDARRILGGLGKVHEENLAREELIARLADYDVLIVRLRSRIDREVLQAAPRLQAIVSATTGLDHIDVEHARAHGVEILSLRGETEFLRGVPATAEHTWGLLLALMRRIPEAVEAVREGEWNRDALRGRDLRGRRLGLVGLGRVGEMVARYGQAFGMEVHAFDPFRAGWGSGVERHRDLDGLLRHADVLSIHAPSDETTRRLIGARELALLPPGAVLVNTSRGELIDSPALLAALAEGQLGGAALDVVPGERDPDNRERSALLEYGRRHRNLLMTPHIAGASADSMARTEIFMAEKLARWAAAR